MKLITIVVAIAISVQGIGCGTGRALAKSYKVEALLIDGAHRCSSDPSVDNKDTCSKGIDAAKDVRIETVRAAAEAAKPNQMIYSDPSSYGMPRVWGSQGRVLQSQQHYVGGVTNLVPSTWGSHGGNTGRQTQTSAPTPTPKP